MNAWTIMLAILLALVTILAKVNYTNYQDLQKRYEARGEFIRLQDKQNKENYIILNVDDSCKTQLEHSDIIQLKVGGETK